MRLRLLILFLLGTATVAAQELRTDQASEGTATALVPVVSNLGGWGGIRWKADVTIVNDTGGSVDLAVELPAAPESPAIFLSLEPGQAQRFGDVIGEAFGLEGVLSPMRITTGGRRSVSVLTSIYAVLPSGGISELQPIPTEYASGFFPTRVLDDLAFSDEERTNIGLVNLSEGPADFLLAVQRIRGRTIAQTRIRVPPLTVYHGAIQEYFPLISRGNGFAVVVETSAASTLVYASVIENDDHAARFVAPRVGF